MRDIFELRVPGEEPLGLAGPWQSSSAPVSFGVEQDPSLAAMPVWRVNLPAGAQAAEHALADAEAQLAASEAQLDQIPGKLEAMSSSISSRGAGVAFDVPSSVPNPGSPEAAVLQLLAEAQAIERGQPVSFGMANLGSQAWERARAQFGTFTAQIQREILNLAWVETRVDVQLLARTAIGWSGASKTVWMEQATSEQMQLHRRAVDVAVRSQLLRIRIFSTVTGGAARLSVLFASPAGALLALPAAWKYVDEILQQVKTYQALSQGGSHGN